MSTEPDTPTPTSPAAEETWRAVLGEILVSCEAADAARLDSGPLEHRSLELNGKRVATEVVVLTATASVGHVS